MCWKPSGYDTLMLANLTLRQVERPRNTSSRSWMHSWLLERDVLVERGGVFHRVITLRFRKQRLCRLYRGTQSSVPLLHSSDWRQHGEPEAWPSRPQRHSLTQPLHPPEVFLKISPTSPLQRRLGTSWQVTCGWVLSWKTSSGAQQDPLIAKAPCVLR